MNSYKTSFLLFTLFWLSLASCGQQQKKNAADEVEADETIVRISAQELNNIDKDILLIDVRTPEEYASGHLENAINIDFKGSDFKNRIAELNKDEDVYVYCKMGGRSGNTAKMMESMGFEKVYDLKGGILQWNKEGFKTVK